MRTRKETQSVYILKRSLDFWFPGGEWIKIPDVGMNNSKTVKRQYDAMYYYKNCRAVFEVKRFVNNDNFYFESVKQHQIDGLIEAWKNGSNAYIVINYYNKEDRYDRFYFIEIDDFIHWKECHKTPSLMLLDLENDFHVCFRLDAKTNRDLKCKILNLDKTYIVG